MDRVVPRVRLYFHRGALLVDERLEGTDHAITRDLFGLIFGLWLGRYSQKEAISQDGCLFEKAEEGAGMPDLAFYIDRDYPQSEENTRKIDLNRWRQPDLVGEISDTTLAIDLDQKKQLYAALGICEYWVIDVHVRRVFLFLLNQSGEYQEENESEALRGLSKSLLEETFSKLETMTITEVANWFEALIAHSGEDA